jgi:hypothetical protein
VLVWQVCGPTDQVNKIASVWNATPTADAQYAVLCDAVPLLPSLEFKLAGSVYTLTANDFVVGRDGSTCTLGLQAQEGSPAWAFGDVFMRKYFTLFDIGRKRVGFALSKRLR